VTEGVGRKVAVGAAFMLLGRLLMRVISVINILILARLLVPDDFGIVMLAAVAIAVLETLTAMNYALALVRRPEITRALYDTAWTMNILRCLLLGVIVAATAEWQAGLLGDPRAGPILMVVALNIALDGFTSVGLIRLQREMRFDLLFRFQVVGKLAAFVVVLALAVTLQNYWCLVLGNLASKLITVPYSYWLAPHTPRLSLKHARELLHFSKWMVAVNACMVVEAQIANLALGRFVGVRALGMWGVSYQLAAVPVTELAVPIRQPIFAGYAQVQHDRPVLRGHYLAGFGLLAAAVVPLSVGIALVSPQLEPLALGPNWVGAAPLIAICALYALVECLAHFTGAIFYIHDAQDRMARIYAALMALRIACVIPGAMLFGLHGVGAAMLATSLVGFVVWHWRTAQLLEMPATAVVAELWRPLAAAAVMAAVVIALQLALPAASGAAGLLGQLLLLAATGAAAHIGTQLLLWRVAGTPDAAERRLIAMAQGALERLRRRAARIA
jgi:O-antigen/teichoic acid export membrane protein